MIKINLEDAEYIIKRNIDVCSGCPMYTPVTGYCVAQSCADAVQDAAKIVIAAKDARIAELEHRGGQFENAGAEAMRTPVHCDKHAEHETWCHACTAWDADSLEEYK